jgi:uncharacterized protein (DUF427 family)
VIAGDRAADAAAWSYADSPESARFVIGYYAFEWDRMDAWYEENDQVQVRARDPYHRVDVPSSSRHVPGTASSR